MSNAPHQNNPFGLLGLARAFDLDGAQIERAWLRAGAALHPDRAGHDDEAARAMARINHARRVLDDPEQRAEALLVLLGGPAREQDKTLPPGFLARVMGEREEMEEALAAGGEAARSEREAAARARLGEHEQRVSELFRGLATPPDAASLRAIRVELNAWRYAQRMWEQLDAGIE